LVIAKLSIQTSAKLLLGNGTTSLLSLLGLYLSCWVCRRSMVTIENTEEGARRSSWLIWSLQMKRLKEYIILTSWWYTREFY